ncbi:MAG TPA: TonB family protein [Pyrinomonadaceae bacterium]|nr:TonB family protein [Pyrinomonadaceae bacterium]
MKNLWLTLTAFLFVASLIPPSDAQKPTTPQEPSSASTEAEKDQPKGDVALALEELEKRGEVVVRVDGEASASTNARGKSTRRFLNSRAIKLAQPEYPAIALSVHVSGEVIVFVLIDKDGKVIAAEIANGHALLRAAALKAAKASRFSPPLQHGKPVNIMGTIIYRFLLDRKI